MATHTDPENDTAPTRVLKSTIGSPTIQSRAPSEAGTEGDETHEVPSCDPPSRCRFRQQNRDRGGGRVAIAVDVDEHFGVVDAEAVLCGANDAQIGLVRDDESEVAAREAVAFKQEM